MGRQEHSGMFTCLRGIGSDLLCSRIICTGFILLAPRRKSQLIFKIGNPGTIQFPLSISRKGYVLILVLPKFTIHRILPSFIIVLHPITTHIKTQSSRPEILRISRLDSKSLKRFFKDLRRLI